MLTEYKIEDELKVIKNKFKENKQPAIDEDFEILIKEMKTYGVKNADIPEELKVLWKISSEWHLIEDHYDVFGFNIYNPKQIIQYTKNIFGDENCKKEWSEYIGKVSCADNDWLCIASYSEYDYIFMNFNRQSRFFSATRHMVNNCTEDEELTMPPFLNFLNYIKDFVKKYQN